VELFPEHCESCWVKLSQTLDAKAERYQTTELPRVRPHTTEYRVHTVTCLCCKHRTKGPYTQVPVSPFGPRLASVVALLTGVYHLSRRSTVSILGDVLGVKMSLGAVSAIEARVSEAVKPAVDEAWEQVRHAPVKHTDGTGWFQSSVFCSLWTVASTMATVFKVVANGKRETLAALFGELLSAIA
jgi:transposase